MREKIMGKLFYVQAGSYLFLFFLQKCQVFRDKGRSDTQRIKEGKGAKYFLVINKMN